MTARKSVAKAEPKATKQPATLRDLITRIEEKLAKGDLRATVGDYIRLLQLEKELTVQEAKEVRLKWKEPEDTSNEK